MENLSMKFIGQSPVIIRKVPYLLGEITIGDFHETFNIAIKWWKKKDYENQWNIALERLKDHDKSCFVAEVCNRQDAHVINWWLIYKEKNMLYIRNEVLYGEYYEESIGDKEFTPQTCFNFIRPKGPNFTECGRKISEWVIPWKQ